ncbi:MAG: response regulator [Kiritimatiellae bacterium]|nr:response regulator [Kiritimatiellia bacterium]
MQAGPSRGQTILLVDDEEHLRVTVSDFLTFQGYTVELARSGEEALKTLDSITPDLIILDISMPGIGGMGFLQRLSRTAGNAPPVVILTARSNLQGFFDGLDVAGFVSKPCEKTVLLGQIQRILGDDAPAREKDAAGDTLHVLLGEDDSDVFEVLKRMFSRHGHSVTRAESGPAVLEAAATAGVDVVVLKEYLTKLNGSAVATLLRTMPSTRAIPIVLYDMVGAISMTGSSSAGSKAPVDRYIEVHEPSEVLDAVEKVIGAA